MSARPQPEQVSIVIPAPNPTGNLHLGHALNLTVQDILARWHRLRGAAVYWEGATDHGGSSTEIVMHRSLMDQARSISDISDGSKSSLLDTLIKKNVAAITRQFEDLRLTLDGTDMRSMGGPEAQLEFESNVIELCNRGYLYPAIKLDDWCYERGQTLPPHDVVPVPTLTKIRSLRYSVGDRAITIDHTELAYLLDEIGILVPATSAYENFNGSHAINPLGKQVPVYAAAVTEPHSLCPSYDETSLNFCLANGLEFASSIDDYGVIRADRFDGLDFRNAADELLAIIRARNAILRSRERSLIVRRCRGTGYGTYKRAVPGLFIRSSVLLESAMQAISSGAVSICPKRHGPDMLAWMKDTIVQGEAADWRLTREHLCGNPVPASLIDELVDFKPGNARAGYRMDMMISCALWSYNANAKYPLRRNREQLERETSICVTGADLVYWWIATSIALSEGIGRSLPFSEVIVHPLIMDKLGRKMSKSLGNTIELDKVIEDFGAPALRLYLLSHWDQSNDFLNVDPDELAQLSASLNAASNRHPTLPANDSARLSADALLADLTAINTSLSERDLGAAARIVLTWIPSMPYWDHLPPDITRRARELVEVFLGDSLEPEYAAAMTAEKSAASLAHAEPR